MFEHDIVDISALWHDITAYQDSRHDFLVRRQILKITSVDVINSVPVLLSRSSLTFYYGKLPGFTRSSLREHKSAFSSSFNAFFTVVRNI